MKRFLLLSQFMLLSALLFGQGNKQHVNYEYDSGWNLGFNGGVSWQQSDVRERLGYGYGFTLGKSIYEKPGKFLAWDLRFRYLRAGNTGFDLNPSLDVDTTIFGDYADTVGHFHNYKMNLHAFDLELVATLNRLRERTGIIVQGFGGLGIVSTKTRANLYNEFGNPYNYATVSQNQGSVETRRDLDLLRDNTYETDVDGGSERQVSLMPTAGLALGYQFTPSFSMGIEHKITFPLHDRLDGVVSDAGSFQNDRHHYTGAFFRWNLFGGRYQNDRDPVIQNPTTPVTNPPVTNTPITSPPPTVNPPIVNIINPSHSPHTVHSPSFTIKANIYYVDGPQNIVFTQNGVINTNFYYNATTKRFESNVTLTPGNNVFEITGTNTAGSDRDSKVIVFEYVTPPPSGPPPVVTFTNPPYTPFEVNANTFAITANILNINGSQDIRFRVNGQTLSNFYFNTANRTFSSNILLNEGTNTVEIKATNQFGQDIEQVQLIYKKPVTLRPPVVTFVDPNVNPKTVNTPGYNVTANVLNVDYKYQISVRVNGTNVPYFNYNNTNKKVTFQANLVPGSNMVEVSATNNDGSDHASTNIILEIPEASPPPIVTIIEPNVNPFHTTSTNGHVVANVLNVAGKSNIELKINGVATTNFTYNSFTKVMEVNTPLVDGANVFSIVATNSVGSDNAGVTIIYDKPEQVLPPVISITVPTSNPYTTTVSSQIINADVLNVPDANNVSAIYNGGSISNFVYDPNTGKFSYNAQLIEGANILEITAWNSAGTASKSQTVIYVKEEVPCDKPTFKLATPTSNPYIATSNKGSFTGTLKGATSLVFKVNGVQTTAFNYNLQTGEFVHYANNLNEGANIYELIGKNACGELSTVVTIIYEKQAPPCVEPSISLIAPSSYSTSTSAKAFNFSFKVSNMTDANGIKVKMNGVTNAFQFDANTGIVTGTANVKDGQNNLEIKANNSCGGDIAVIRIDKRRAVTTVKFPPTVKITDPAGASHTTTDANYTVIAKVTNVFSKNEITVTKDGSAVTFTYNAATKTVTIPTSLAVGGQTVEVAVANANGSAHDEVELVRVNPCTTPKVTMTSPGSGQHTVTAIDGKVKAKVEHADEVQVTLNGANYSDFTFDPASGNVEITYHFDHSDEYLFVVNASHPNCGAASGTTTLVYQQEEEDPCDPPVLNIVTPQANPFTSPTSQFDVQVSFQNITNKSQVTVMVNNQQVNALRLTSGGLMEFTADLKNGSNAIEVSARTDCGNTTASTTILFSGQSGHYDDTLVDPTDQGEPPVVNFVIPSSSPYNTVLSVEPVKARITNCDQRNQIVITVNNRTISDVVFSNNYGIAEFNANLNNGINIVEVKATNDYGTDSELIQIVKDKGNGNGNNGHGNNTDGVDSSNPGQGNGGPNGSDDPSGGVDDENGNNGNGGNGNGNGNNGMMQQDNTDAKEAERLKKEKDRQEALEKLKRETEAKKKAQEEARKKAAAEAERKAAEEKARKAADAKAKMQEELKREAEEAARKKAEEDAAKKQAEDAARKKAQADAAKKAAEDKARREAEMKRQAEDAARKKAQADAAKKAAEDRARKEAELKRQAEQRARMEAEKKRQAEEAKRRAEEEARKKAAAEAAKRKAQEEARKKAAAEEARRKAEALKAAQEKARKEAEAKKKAEEAKRKAEEEAKKKAEAEKQKAIQPKTITTRPPRGGR